jgi:hypothetical protein
LSSVSGDKNLWHLKLSLTLYDQYIFTSQRRGKSSSQVNWKIKFLLLLLLLYLFIVSWFYFSWYMLQCWCLWVLYIKYWKKNVRGYEASHILYTILDFYLIFIKDCIGSNLLPFSPDYIFLRCHSVNTSFLHKLEKIHYLVIWICNQLFSLRFSILDTDYVNLKEFSLLS